LTRREIIEQLYARGASKEEISTVIKVYNRESQEIVAPKFNAWRAPARWKIAYGGRGAGAKSWSASSLLVQKAHYKHTEIGCFREIQKTLAESSHKLIGDTIKRLEFPFWKITDEHIKHKYNGSSFIFKGLKDLRASLNVKGIEGLDIGFIEEASSVSYESWVYLPATIRKKGSELWAVFNREEEMDPIYELYVQDPPDDSIILQLRPGAADNPWWYNTELQKEWDWWFRHDPDEAEHIFLGQPRKQGQNAALSRVAVRAAMNRNIKDPCGAIVCGCDPADFGDDKTEIYVRKGMKVIASKTLTKMDGNFIAGEIAKMINYDDSVLINLDTTGIGTSTRDRLRAMGLNVNPIHFAQSPKNKDKYHDLTTEMVFEFPIDEADIPDDQDLMKQMAGRRYSYDSRGRAQIEPKPKFKERFQKSPDKFDALMLCFYNGNRIEIPRDDISAMGKRKRIV
jgi:hypothetical protein